MGAAISGRTSCIRALLKSDCHINRKHADGANALERHIAESKRKNEKAMLLLFAAGETWFQAPWRPLVVCSLMTSE